MFRGALGSSGQIHVAMLGDVEAVVVGTEQAVVDTEKGFSADGAAKDAAAVGKTNGIVHKYLAKVEILMVC